MSDAGRWKPNWSMPAGSADLWPEDYERGRPGWPPEVTAVAGVPPSATVLEVAAGTGKLTRLLLHSFDAVVAVEPARAMRHELVRLCPGVHVVGGSAEQIPLDDSSVDAVFVAEAFHHFDHARALGEFARVLPPGGPLVLMWNLPAGPWVPTIEAVERLIESRIGGLAALTYEPLDLDGRMLTSGAWQAPFASSPFEELRHTTLPNPQTVDRAGLLAFVASMGWIADLPDAERLRLLEQARTQLDAPEYRRRWVTHVYWTRRAAGKPVEIL